MKLIKLLIESIEESLDLIPTTDTDSMLKNLYTIAFNSGSRIMVNMWAIEYVGKYPDVFKKLRDEINVNDRESFERFMGNLQKKARAESNKIRKTDIDAYNREKAEHDIEDIIKMAIDQNSEWEKRIADKEKLK